VNAEPQQREPTSLLEGRFRGVAEAAPPGERRLRLPLGVIDRAAALLVEDGARFVTLFLDDRRDPSLLAVFALRGVLVVLRAPRGERGAYASLGIDIPAARWVERELHDLNGLTPLGHPDLRPFVRPNADDLRRRVVSPETFTIPYGPIRSGIFEAIQFTIETGGEDVLVLETRPGFKRRALEQRMTGLSFEHAVQVAERFAGIASVAYSIAFAQAVERALDCEIPRRSENWRAVYAELERIANHLDVAARLAEDPALAVGNARFAILKEDVLRLQARLTGSRFARGIVLPGGVRAEGGLSLDELGRQLDRFEHAFRRDRTLLLGTTSFTDRLIGSGALDRETIEEFGGVGPPARAVGIATDARFERPYGGYRRLGFELITRDDGDAMARLEVRLGEIEQSLHLLRQACDRLRRSSGTLQTELPAREGAALGWAEAPQGEVVIWVAVADGRVELARVASPDFRNWQLFAESFGEDVLTDFAFIEHSFGLTPAGADR
jgi:formate hydrogenlyase subunit 5